MTTQQANPDVVVVGAGLAGCEAALQLAGRGHRVRLYEQKPAARSEASASNLFAELVCSNSFRAKTPENAVGMLKEEMERLGSFFMAAARQSEIPAGGALAVDRERFSAWLTGRVRNHANIEVVEQEVTEVPKEAEEVILATGPLTSDAFAEQVAALTNREHLHFYDAIAPIVEADSIDLNKAFFQSRYDKGGDDYLNCPFSKAEYDAFVAELLQAEKVAPRDFEKPKYFEGCLPVEVLAERGEKTLAFGPMKPVGLLDPHTGKMPYAVIQLRAENANKSAYSLVGFQTRMKHAEQQRVFRMIPGLEHAVFQRLGSVHRNTFINSTLLVDRHIRLRRDPRISFAGQLSGVEGYVESAASGLAVALFTDSRLRRQPIPPMPLETMIGALMAYLVRMDEHFQPSNVTHGMLPALQGKKLRKRDRKLAYAERAREKLTEWIVHNRVALLTPRQEEATGSEEHGA